jgi:hypothetical protein
MERKQFLGATVLAGAALAMVGAGTATNATNGSNASSLVNCGGGVAPAPRPTGSPGAHPPHAHHSEIESAYRHVERVIEMLGKDTNDYDGHKTPALGFLNQAAGELQQAVAYAQAHPASPPPSP